MFLSDSFLLYIIENQLKRDIISVSKPTLFGVSIERGRKKNKLSYILKKIKKDIRIP